MNERVEALLQPQIKFSVDILEVKIKKCRNLDEYNIQKIEQRFISSIFLLGKIFPITRSSICFSVGIAVVLKSPRVGK